MPRRTDFRFIGNNGIRCINASGALFIIFIVFSVLGLLLNNLIMWITVDFLSIYYLLAKILATIIVMVFNFVTRKIFLE